MTEIDQFKQYVDEIFSKVSDYDNAVSEVIPHFYQFARSEKFFPNSDLSNKIPVNRKPLEFSDFVVPGKFRLELFIDDNSVLNKETSFLCSIAVYDADEKAVPVEDLPVSSRKDIGNFFYVARNDGGTVFRDFTVPATGRILKAKILKFPKGRNSIKKRVKRMIEGEDSLFMKPYYKLIPLDLVDSVNSIKTAKSGLYLALKNKRCSQMENAKRADFPPFIYLMDEFTEKCFTSVSKKSYRLSRTNFFSQLATASSNILLLESVWNGNSGDWQGAMTYADPHHAQKLALTAAIQTAKTLGKKTVFYNKEDPMHFDRFLPVAEKSDVIFTSDSDCVENYKKHFPDKEVLVLKFASPTSICNPIRMPAFEERDSVAFAGGYYGKNHDARVEQMDYLLPALTKFNGTIFDRHSGQPDDRYRYPDRFKMHCKPSIPYEQMIREYRKFKVFLNVNTITESPTMLSRRVYELLGSGTPVVTAPSRAIEEQFGDHVSIVDNEADAITAVEALLTDKWHWLQKSHLGYRHVMNGNTYADRLEQVFSTVCSEYEVPKQDRVVSMITPTKEPGSYVRIIENAINQSHKKLELVIGFGYLYSEEDVTSYLRKLERAITETGKKITVRHVHFKEKISLGSKLNALIQEATGDIIAKMDDDDFYGQNYLTDALLPMRWGNFDIVGKAATFWKDVTTGKFYLKHPKKFHRDTDFAYGATFIGSRKAFLENPFEDRSRGEDSMQLAKLLSNGYKIYASDPFNFCYLRRESQHTWALPENFFLKDCEELPQDFSISQIEI